MRPLDYWQRRAKCYLLFLYFLLEKYEEAIALIKKELERNRPLYEKPFSNLKLVGIFFRKSKGFLEDYEYDEKWKFERLARGMGSNTRDKDIEWSLRAAFAFGKCLNEMWEENKKTFIDNGEMTEEAAKEDALSLRELTKKIKNIEGEIV